MYFARVDYKSLATRRNILLSFFLSLFSFLFFFYSAIGVIFFEACVSQNRSVRTPFFHDISVPVYTPRPQHLGARVSRARLRQVGYVSTRLSDAAYRASCITFDSIVSIRDGGQPRRVDEPAASMKGGRGEDSENWFPRVEKKSKVIHAARERLGRKISECFNVCLQTN